MSEVDLSTIDFKPRRGRRPLPADKKKGQYIRFLLTNAEREMLDELADAHDKAMSELLRSMIRTCYAADKKKGVIS